MSKDTSFFDGDFPHFVFNLVPQSVNSYPPASSSQLDNSYQLGTVTHTSTKKSNARQLDLFELLFLVAAEHLEKFPTHINV